MNFMSLKEEKCLPFLYEFNHRLNVLKLVEPLLCNDREMGGYTRAVSGQRLNKQVPATIELLLGTGCFYAVPAGEL
jgi:hypothetical protein